MTTTTRITAAKRVPMDSLRKTALVAAPVKNHRDWILGSSGHDRPW
jgi:hypothetical protein